MLCVLVVLLSEERKMCSSLRKRGITTETLRRAENDPSFPIKILPARYLAKLYQELGTMTGSRLCQDRQGSPHNVFRVVITAFRVVADFPPSLLVGVSSKMGLSGRPMQTVGVVGTSQLYRIHETVVAFTPQFLDHEAFYLCLDNRLLVDLVRTDLAYLKANWKLMGRPTIVLPLMW